MGNSRQAFERSLLVDRVVSRFAGEFTPAEWEAHKKEHPGANRADHTITKGEKPSKDDAYQPPSKRLSDGEYDKLHKELHEEMPTNHPDRPKKVKEYQDEQDARAQDKYKKRDEQAKK